MERPVKERCVAFLDIGTNSVRILVVKLHPDYSYTVLTRQKETVRLGEGLFSGRGYLKRPAIDRTVLVCCHFTELARSFKADPIVAVATSATREARNRQILLRRLKEQAGLDVQVISGKEEARLTYLGVASGLNLGSRKAVFIDIGGGSTEVIVGSQGEFDFLDSKKLGAIRLNSLFPNSDSTGRINKKLYSEIRSYVDEVFLNTYRALGSHRIDCGVGSSGTIENLWEIAARMLYHGDPPGEKLLRREDLVKIIGILRSRGLEERKKVPGINPERADIIVHGAAILESFMEGLDLKELHVSERGLREGMMFDYLQRQEGYFPVHEMSIRLISVLRLARLFHVDEAHANTITRLALSLFDSAKEAGLHRLDEKKRNLLEFAAILHDVGSYLSFENHENHSFYVIKNGDLLGFSEQEITMMAYIARYHRKYLNPRQAKNIIELDAHSKHDIRVMANILCLANSLDRGHTGVIREAKFHPDDREGICITLKALNRCDLELWGLMLHRKDFEKVFNKKLRIEVQYLSTGS